MRGDGELLKTPLFIIKKLQRETLRANRETARPSYHSKMSPDHEAIRSRHCRVDSMFLLPATTRG